MTLYYTKNKRAQANLEDVSTFSFTKKITSDRMALGNMEMSLKGNTFPPPNIEFGMQIQTEPVLISISDPMFQICLHISTIHAQVTFIHL